jgi:hypothetical protein
LGALSLGVKRPGREADQSRPSIAEVQKEWNYASTSLTYLHGMYRDNFTFYHCLITICKTYSKRITTSKNSENVYMTDYFTYDKNTMLSAHVNPKLYHILVAACM